MAPTSGSPPAATLVADPFTALSVHYGMLLGVPDFQVLAANPRGKLRLHQAWQHGPGVVWGYPLDVPADTAELRVGAGLAVDGIGREVALATPHCVDVGAWLDGQIEAGTIEPEIDGDVSTFNARLVVRFRACLSGPVPAMTSACDGGGGDIAYSRIIETAELELRPYGNDDDGSPEPPADVRGDAHPALRTLFRDGDAGAVDPPATGWLHAFRAVAAAEVAAMGPPGVLAAAPDRTRLFPEDEPGEVVLADLPGLRVVNTPAGRRLEAPVVDLSVRRTHVSTWMLEELLAELLAGRGGPGPSPVVAGPRVTGVELDTANVTVTLSADVVEGTIEAALEVRSFDAAAASPVWSDPVAVTTTFAAAQPGPPEVPATITVTLPAPPTDQLTYRLVLRGTGPTPLVGLADGRPVALAGWDGGPAGTAAEGHDVVVLLPDATTA
jgi:hypothetical protein